MAYRHHMLAAFHGEDTSGDGLATSSPLRSIAPTRPCFATEYPDPGTAPFVAQSGKTPHGPMSARLDGKRQAT